MKDGLTQVKELKDKIHEQYIEIQELNKKIEELELDLQQTNNQLADVSKRCIEAIEIIRQNWYKKNTIPIEEIGTSNDLRVELFKTLLGVDKE